MPPPPTHLPSPPMAPPHFPSPPMAPPPPPPTHLSSPPMETTPPLSLPTPAWAWAHLPSPPMETPPWADLRPEVLEVIFMRLHLTDAVRCLAVCQSWRAAALRCSLPVPWLVMPSSTGTRVYLRYLDGSVDPISSYPAFAAQARVYSSFPGGCLTAAIGRWDGNMLFAIGANGSRIALPDVVRTRCGNYEEDRDIGIFAVCLSGYPALPLGSLGSPSYTAAAISTGRCSLSFWRPGMDAWAPPGPAEDLLSVQAMLGDSVEDIVFHDGLLGPGYFVLDSDERLVVFMPQAMTSSSAGPLPLRYVRYTFYGTSTAHEYIQHQEMDVLAARYLVVSRGELIMVRRYISADGRTTSFAIFGLDSEQQLEEDVVGAVWRFYPFFPGRLLFLSRGSSMSIEAGVPGQSMIYFLDDITFGDIEQLLDPSMHFPSTDVGRTQYRSHRVDFFSPERGPADNSPFYWLFH